MFSLCSRAMLIVCVAILANRHWRRAHRGRRRHHAHRHREPHHRCASSHSFSALFFERVVVSAALDRCDRGADGSQTARCEIWSLNCFGRVGGDNTTCSAVRDESGRRTSSPSRARGASPPSPSRTKEMNAKTQKQKQTQNGIVFNDLGQTVLQVQTQRLLAVHVRAVRQHLLQRMSRTGCARVQRDCAVDETRSTSARLPRLLDAILGAARSSL